MSNFQVLDFFGVKFFLCFFREKTFSVFGLFSPKVEKVSFSLRRGATDGSLSLRLRYQNAFAAVEGRDNWDLGYHGTWFYGVRNILCQGVMLESRNEEEGLCFSFFWRKRGSLLIKSHGKVKEKELGGEMVTTLLG